MNTAEVLSFCQLHCILIDINSVLLEPPSVGLREDMVPMYLDPRKMRRRGAYRSTAP
jgi:hypothetical protein